MHQVEPTSTAAYGLAHIFAALSVTNKELKTKALADRGVTPDQYEQMQKLQKITPRRAAAGAAGAADEEEAAAEAAAAEQLNQDVDEGSDPDTEALCLARVRRVASLGGVAVLLVNYNWQSLPVTDQTVTVTLTGLGGCAAPTSGSLFQVDANHTSTLQVRTSARVLPAGACCGRAVEWVPGRPPHAAATVAPQVATPASPRPTQPIEQRGGARPPVTMEPKP